jgi:hypothetical protein
MSAVAMKSLLNQYPSEPNDNVLHFEPAYPHQLSICFGIADNAGVWKRQFHDLTTDDVLCAVDKILNLQTSHNTFPPTPMEFRQLCLEIKSLKAKEAQSKARAEHYEKLEEQKQKQLTKVCIAAQNGWGYTNMTPDQTMREFMFGDLRFSQIEKELEEFLKAHDELAMNGQNLPPEARCEEMRHVPATAA